MNFTLPEWVIKSLDLQLEAPRWTHNSYRPLTILSFRWDHWRHGLTPSGYRVTSIALHAGGVALLKSSSVRTLLVLP